MVLPMVVTLADDALSSVPAAQRRAARALGLTRAETIWAVCLPQARRGIGAALLLGFGRALGETIAVFLVVGRQDNNLPERWWAHRELLEAGQTLTTKLGSSEINIAYGDPHHWGAMMGLGLLLLVMTGSATMFGTLRRRTDAAA
jgi:phosphate transport system permease protein